MPAKYDLDLYRGDSYGWQFVLWQDDARTVAVDLSTATAASEIRDKPSGMKIVVMDCTITLPNIVTVLLSSALCTSCPSKGVWDLQITYADGQVQTPIGGTVKVTADVTVSV